MPCASWPSWLYTLLAFLRLPLLSLCLRILSLEVAGLGPSPGGWASWEVVGNGGSLGDRYGQNSLCPTHFIQVHQEM